MKLFDKRLTVAVLVTCLTVLGCAVDGENEATGFGDDAALGKQIDAQRSLQATDDHVCTAHAHFNNAERNRLTHHRVLAATTEYAWNTRDVLLAPGYQPAIHAHLINGRVYIYSDSASEIYPSTQVSCSNGFRPHRFLLPRTDSGLSLSQVFFADKTINQSNRTHRDVKFVIELVCGAPETGNDRIDSDPRNCR